MATRATDKGKGKKAAEKATRGGRSAPEPKGEKQEGRGSGKTLLGGLDAVRGFAETTSRVVRQAASILEEEIAAGIVAARQVEESLINVKALRAGNADSVIHRFRKDAHEVVDILVDLVGTAAQYAEEMSKRAVSFRVSGNPGRAERQEAESAPYLKVPGVLKPGQSAQAPMTLENSGSAPTEPMRFVSTDLVSPSGGVIPARQIAFKPAALTIQPGGRGTVVVQLKIPAGAKPGLYSGLVQSSRADRLRAVLAVEVA